MTTASTKLSPGAYLAARALSGGGLAALGTHQFLVLVPERPESFSIVPQDLATGIKGVVLGAYNDGGQLRAAKFADSDTKGLIKFLAGDTTVRFEISPVNLGVCPMSLDSVLEKYVQAFFAYQANSTKKPIAYPSEGAMVEDSGCINSNSFAQSLVAHGSSRAGVNASFQEDFKGYDACNETRISGEYFR